jgi:hypothetical protein
LIVATFGGGTLGDITFSASSSAPLTQMVNRVPSATVVVSSINPSIFRQAVTFTATVSATTSVPLGPSGTVTFTIDGVAQTPVALVNGVATFTIATLGVGSHTIVVTYNGDGNFLTSTSPPLTQVVQAVPLTSPYIVVGSDAGVPAEVEVFNSVTKALLFAAFPFGIGFTGGVRVALGDVNQDGVPDIIVGAGPGGAPQVRVYDGRTFQPLAGPLSSFLGIFPTGFTGGVFVAAGDVDGDGFADIIVGADAGGGPEVNVFSGRTGAVLYSFLAFPASFNGGVRVAAGDVNGDGKADIITGAGPGALPQVSVFNGASLAGLLSFYAFPTSFNGGVYVAAGDVDNSGKVEIVVGAGAGALPQVNVFSGQSNGRLLGSYFATDPRQSDVLNINLAVAASAGVRVSTTLINRRSEILTGLGPGAAPLVDLFDGATLVLLDSFFAFNAGFRGGIFVAG